MNPLEVLDILSRIGVLGILAILVFVLMTERLIPKGRLDEKQKELEDERQGHKDDRTAFEAAIRALNDRDRQR